MNSTKLSERNTKWVKEARLIGDNGENNLETILTQSLPHYYLIISKPRELSKIYGSHGVVPDLCIINTINDKRIYIEKKTGNNGGNAHERAYKYLSPLLKQKVKSLFNTPEEPFFFVFSGDTFKKNKYKQEISVLLGHIPEYYFIIEDYGHTSQLCDMIKSVLEF